MLRILKGELTQRAGDATLHVRLAGQVRGQWVDELRRLCSELLSEGHALEIEMADVSFVDERGVRLFGELAGGRVTLVNCALFVAEQLKSTEWDA